MEIHDDIIRKKWVEANELEIGECFKYDGHIYLKTKIVVPTSCQYLVDSIAYVDLTANKTYPGYELNGIDVEPVKAHVQIKYCK